MSADMLSTALAALDVGLSVVQARVDGSKYPTSTWAQYQRERASRQQVEGWFGNGHAGIGIVCGAISGNVECLDIEGRFMAESADAFAHMIDAVGLRELVARLTAGYCERTPSGGVHFLYRLEGATVPGSTKLAQRPATPDELAVDPKNTLPTLIETKGEGGFVIIAPSHGSTHLNGLPWVLASGNLGTIPTISIDEREWLLSVCRSFDETPAKSATSASTKPPDASGGFIDEVCRQLDAEGGVAAIAKDYGWEIVDTLRDGRPLLRRPGKDSGHSAQVSRGGRLLVYSSSTEFDSDKKNGRYPTFDALDVIAMYDHGGDRVAAARVEADRRGIPRGRVSTSVDTPAPEPIDWLRSCETGDVFVLDGPEGVEPRWGSPTETLWGCGEPLMLCGPAGAGKTTIAVQLVEALVGISDRVLGVPVMPSRRVLYLALDRPRQIMRAMRRRFGDEHRAILRERLLVRKGPLPVDLAKATKQLVELAQLVDADVIVVDSLKDVCPKLSDDEAASCVNSAMQHCVAAGIDVAILHHQRKAQVGAKAPNALSDVYGSTWLTAGCGSVVLLWGEAGAELIELTHLKPISDPVGPWRVEHDHIVGLSKVAYGFDALAFLRRCGDAGASVAQAAQAEHGAPQDSSGAKYKKTERRLRGLAEKKLAVKVGSRYFITEAGKAAKAQVDSGDDGELL